MSHEDDELTEVSDEFRDSWLAGIGDEDDDLDEADEDETDEMRAARAHLDKHTYTADQLDALPLPEWQVREVLVKNSLTYLAGAPNHGKSFVAISLACSIATGVSWFSRPVMPGNVLYLAAEGGQGVRKRVRVWERENGIAVDNRMTVITVPVQIDVRSPLWRVLVERITSGQYALIVIDTQARMTVGKDENSQQDMSPVVELLEGLRRTDGSPTVLVVHHSSKASTGPSLRGSSALTAACEAIIGVKRTHQRKKGAPPTATPTKIEVTCERQKDSEAFDDLYFDLVNVVLDDFDSAVLRPGAPYKKPNGPVAVAVEANEKAAKKLSRHLQAVRDNDGDALVVSIDVAEHVGIGYARDWLDELGEDWVTGKQLMDLTGKDSVQSILRAIKRADLDVEKDGGRGGPNVRYRLTPETVEQLLNPDWQEDDDES